MEIITALVSFWIGSIPFGLLIAKLFKVRDLRVHGSGNVGATNVTRVLGFWPAGAITFLLDVLKGSLPVLVCGPIGNHFLNAWFGLELPELSELGLWGVGLAAVLGHCYSPWLQFSGGKGVATGFGVVAVLSPVGAVVGILTFALVFFTTRTGSLGSLFGVSAAAVAHLIYHSADIKELLGAIMISVIIFRHESNIDRLLEGDESPLVKPNG
jgi:glycerol-3-phosphate acyltransferase PlsY